MNFWTIDALEKSPGPTGITKQKVPHSYSTQTIQLTLEPGAVLPAHDKPVNVLFYVLEGAGLVTVGDEKEQCKAGMYIESPKDVMHGWENTSTAPLKVLVIKLS
jgi:quercetin dioxygenase-like cupin family protein